jgi:maleylacetate reductase
VREFIFNGQPSRVVFGAGSLVHLEREIEFLGAKRALVLSTPEQTQQAQMVADRLGHRAAGISRHVGWARIAPLQLGVGPPSDWARR